MSDIKSDGSAPDQELEISLPPANILTFRRGLPEVTKILFAITGERQFQDEKFGPLNQGGGHTLGEWVLLIEAELMEAKQALIKGGSGRNSLRSELVQVAALVFACLEQHGVEDPTEKRQI
jgi:hypothetical protein